ncbi:hypothetical protein MTBBW1_1390014 [Desulfamplus magnetovallimortis]|uniref:Uncharacterized protein n=1 Tax=Desulfamplus magnetovallimortis TaxID=1246637 RepID=A0A1W1H7Z2_9BACT|nr:hypothetical protein MTBBW1_1390014 [Desulfamplus magnetovallimortis]
MNKNSFKFWFKMTHQQMVNHPIPEICCKNFPQLGLFLHKAYGGRGVVCATAQLIIKINEIVRKSYLEPQRIYGIALVLPALEIGIIQIFQRKKGYLPFYFMCYHRYSCSRTNTPNVVIIGLIVVVNIAIVEIHVPRVISVIGVRTARPVHGQKVVHPLLC